MRLVGPNCRGLANTEDRVRLDATFAAAHPAPGLAGVAVQSGGVGIALLGGLERLGIGVSGFVSLGDKYDVSDNDMLQWWESDGRTDLALLHLESFGNPRAFSRTARCVTRRMPFLTVDAERTEAGRHAAASHTAAAATTIMTRRALFAQAGITATRTIPELLETAALLHSQPLPAASRVVVVTNAGGAGVLPRRPGWPCPRCHRAWSRVCRPCCREALAPPTPSTRRRRSPRSSCVPVWTGSQPTTASTRYSSHWCPPPSRPRCGCCPRTQGGCRRTPTRRRRRGHSPMPPSAPAGWPARHRPGSGRRRHRTRAGRAAVADGERPAAAGGGGCQSGARPARARLRPRRPDPAAATPYTRPLPAPPPMNARSTEGRRAP